MKELIKNNLAKIVEDILFKQYESEFELCDGYMMHRDGYNFETWFLEKFKHLTNEW